jgi:predicted nucleic acid-binding protein
MNLKDFLATRDKPPELYWSLVLESGWIQAGVWYIGQKSAEIVATSPPTPWEVESELVGAADTALSSAIQKLPEEYPEPSKTVFGVPSDWVKGGEISTEKLEIIKKLCSELSLTPVGFVVLPEAIAHLFKTEEGSPVNAIIVGLGKESLEISVFKLGNLAGSTNVARSVSIVDDVTEGLSRFEGASPLPSRFILFDGKGAELEEARETLTAESWEDSKISFLHTPKVEILESDKKVFATSLAGAAEIGDVSAINTVADEVVAESLPLTEDVENVTSPTEEVTPEDLGFSVGEDVSLAKALVEETVEPQPQVPQPAVGVVNTPPVRPRMVMPPLPIDGYVQKTKSIISGVSGKLHFPSIPSFPKRSAHGGSTNKKPLTLLGILGGVLFFAVALYWWFVPKAEITIYVTPKTFQENLSVTLSRDGQFDPAGGILPAEIIEETITGEKTSPVTGSKTVGDRAKGEVEIQNGTAFPINLPSGTVISSSSNLKFITESSASVSAALSPTNPGKATLAVTADAIGSEYNLAKGEVFKVGNYPKAEVDSTAVADFAGGSSRTISAVSKEDTANMSSQLKEELKVNATSQLEGKVNEKQHFIKELLSFETSSETFDRKVGDEADNLKLDLSIEAKAVAVDKDKLSEFTREILKDKVPSGFVLRETQVQHAFTFEEEVDGKLKYKLALNANFLPETDLESIKKDIVGKTPEAAVSFLSTVPGFTKAGVTLKPKFPGPFGLIPRIKKNIGVEIVAEK